MQRMKNWTPKLDPSQDGSDVHRGAIVVVRDDPRRMAVKESIVAIVCLVTCGSFSKSD
jgi:hypothetical protein